MRAKSHRWCAAIVTGFFASMVVASARAGDPDAGSRVAVRHCDICHSVDRSLNPPNLAPSLLDLAHQAKGGAAWLRAWLNAPHPALRTVLSREQVDDVVAYLARLTKSR